MQGPTAEPAEHAGTTTEPAPIPFKEAPRGGGKHVGGLNREQYRKLRRVWNNAPGVEGRHPHGKLTSRRNRLASRMATRAALAEPVRRSDVARQPSRTFKVNRARLGFTGPERTPDVLAALGVEPVKSDRRKRSALDRYLTARHS